MEKGDEKKDQRLQVYTLQGKLVQTIEEEDQIEDLLNRLLEGEVAAEGPEGEKLLGYLVMEQMETLKWGQNPDNREWMETIRFQIGEETGLVEMLPTGGEESLLSWAVAFSQEDREKLALLWQ